MPDSWDSEDGQPHSMGDGCTPPHTLPEPDPEDECTSSNDSSGHYSVNAGYRIASTKKATMETIAGGHPDLDTLLTEVKRSEPESCRAAEQDRSGDLADQAEDRFEDARVGLADSFDEQDVKIAQGDVAAAVEDVVARRRRTLLELAEETDPLEQEDEQRAT